MKNLVIILLISITNTLVAQDSKYNSLQLNWGVGHIMRQDVNFTPFIHRKGSPLNFGLTFSRSKNLEQQLDLKFGLYNPIITEPYSYTSFYNGDETSLPHSFKLIDIDYALGKKVLNNTKWSIILGGRSRNFIYPSDYTFGVSGPSPMFISFGIDTWMKMTWRPAEKQYLQADLSLPLFAWVYRAPWLAQDDEFFENISSHNGLKELASRIADGSLRSWGNAQRLEFGLQYGYSLNERWDIALSYLFSLNMNQSPAKFTQFENVIFLGGKIKF